MSDGVAQPGPTGGGGAVVGVGIDVVDVTRFLLALDRAPRLRERLFTPAERDLPPNSLAARFAAKEAIAKALGSPGGMRLARLHGAPGAGRAAAGGDRGDRRRGGRPARGDGLAPVDLARRRDRLGDRDRERGAAVIRGWSAEAIRAAEAPALAAGRPADAAGRGGGGAGGAGAAAGRDGRPGRRPGGARARRRWQQRRRRAVRGRRSGRDHRGRGRADAVRGPWRRARRGARGRRRRARREPAGAGDWDALLEVAETADVWVDALAGIGVSGALRGATGEVVERLRQLAETAPVPPVVVAVDLPSGVDADTGAVPGPVLAADVTVTFGGAKAGLLLPPGDRLCGERARGPAGTGGGARRSARHGRAAAGRGCRRSLAGARARMTTSTRAVCWACSRGRRRTRVPRCCASAARCAPAAGWCATWGRAGRSSSSSRGGRRW